MSEKLFYLYVNEEQTDPLPVSEIIEKLKSNTYKLSDLIYDEESETWVTIVSHDYIMKCVSGVDQSEEPTFPGKDTLQEGTSGEENSSKGTSDINQEANSSGLDEDKAKEELSKYTEKTWFVLRNEDRYGPFDHVEIAQMLLSSLVYEYDYTWKQGLEQWMKIAEVSDFEKSSIEKLSQLEGVNFDEPIEDKFFRRKYPRRLCNIPVVIQSGETLYLGTGISIGESGAAITVENADIEDQSIILLDFKPGDHLPSFSAKCKVVNITKDDKGSSRYGIEFVKLDPDIQNQIANFSQPQKEPELPNKESE